MEPGDRTPPPEETLTRRVCAVLLADVTGFSALMGQDDERTARAVRSLQELVQRLAAENQGHAEGFAGDAIFASFDSVLAAVEAALNIQRHLLRETFEGFHLKIRIGVHYGEELLVRGIDDRAEITGHPETLANAFELGRRLVQG